MRAFADAALCAMFKADEVVEFMGSALRAFGVSRHFKPSDSYVGALQDKTLRPTQRAARHEQKIFRNPFDTNILRNHTSTAPTNHIRVSPPFRAEPRRNIETTTASAVTEANSGTGETEPLGFLLSSLLPTALEEVSRQQSS